MMRWCSYLGQTGHFVGFANTTWWESVIVLCFVVCSRFAIILTGKRELVALLTLSSWCPMIVVWLCLAMPRVCLQSVIVVFPDHTHLIRIFGYFN